MSWTGDRRELIGIVVDLRFGAWRGPLADTLLELIRRTDARPAGSGVHVEIKGAEGLEDAAELVDQMGPWLLAGTTVVAICGDGLAADAVEQHARIYAGTPAH
jgi:hypothetical protein